MNKIRVQFCTECREETQYRIRSISYVKQIRDKEYVFELEDTNVVQVFDIDYKQNTIEKPVNIEVEVLETYAGEKTEDIYISDMQFSINSNIPQGR